MRGEPNNLYTARYSTSNGSASMVRFLTYPLYTIMGTMGLENVMKRVGEIETPNATTVLDRSQALGLRREKEKLGTLGKLWVPAFYSAPWLPAITISIFMAEKPFVQGCTLLCRMWSRSRSRPRSRYHSIYDLQSNSGRAQEMLRAERRFIS